MYKFNTKLLNFTITDPNWQYAISSNGVQSDGSLDAHLSVPLNSSKSDTSVIYIIPDSTS